jgi:HTH-type transcriptional regulator / antitoxin HipB
MMMDQAMPRRICLTEARQARIDRPEMSTSYEHARLHHELAEAVRLRREELGWSQRQLAQRAGMSQSGVARFEAGGSTPTLPLLEGLARHSALPSLSDSAQGSVARCDHGSSMMDRRRAI